MWFAFCCLSFELAFIVSQLHFHQALQSYLFFFRHYSVTYLCQRYTFGSVVYLLKEHVL